LWGARRNTANDSLDAESPAHGTTCRSRRAFRPGKRRYLKVSRCPLPECVSGRVAVLNRPICSFRDFSLSGLESDRLAGFKAFIWSNLCTRHSPKKLTPRGHEGWPDKRATRRMGWVQTLRDHSRDNGVPGHHPAIGRSAQPSAFRADALFHPGSHGSGRRGLATPSSHTTVRTLMYTAVSFNVGTSHI
jgi:hypothetical protein